MAKNPIQESRTISEKKAITADFFLENGRLMFRTEEEVEEQKHDLIQELQFFDGKFCTLTIKTEEKSDTLEVESVEEE
jgi:hypothetical protein